MTRSTPDWKGKTDDSRPPPRVIARLALKQDGRCACGCGRKFTVKECPECDHIVALINGGANVEGNLQLLRSDCHRLKTNVDLEVKSKTARIRAKHLGIKKPSGFQTDKFTKHLDGRVTDKQTGEQVWPR